MEDYTPHPNEISMREVTVYLEIIQNMLSFSEQELLDKIKKSVK